MSFFDDWFSSSPQDAKDYRVRIAVPPGNKSVFGGPMTGGGLDFSKGLWEGLFGGGDDTSNGSENDVSEVLAPIRRTKGVLFPYTPTMNVQHLIEYMDYDLVHTNYQFGSFSKSRPPQIDVGGVFTAQSDAEAKYMIGAIHFLRTVSKMHFGEKTTTPGKPPPVLRFYAYGDLMFKNVPVVIRSFSYDLPNEVDYVEVDVPYSGGKKVGSKDSQSGVFRTKVPSVMNVFVSMSVQHRPSDVRTDWNYNDFRKGMLVKNEGFI
jgi:hypothetical protein